MSERTTGTRVLDRPGVGPVVAVRRAEIRVVEGTNAPVASPVGLLSVVVGSSGEAHLRVDDATVSARHVELRMVEDGCLVRDLGSRNGTFLDTIRVHEVVVARSCRLRIGASTLELLLEDAEDELPLSRATNFGGLLGHGASMRNVFAMLDRVARTDATVLITGESGTGKELAARAIHDRSKRREGPYVVFDCAAVSPTLIESQLFGHARGSFTGATEARAGLLETAHGGTLVLDEIGELPLELQPKLLRVLETRTVQRLGETKPREVDVRFVACTHRNLAEEVRAGRFREDLFFRLSVVTVRMPPLRERLDEIPRLVAHFRRRIGGDDAPELPEEVSTLLMRHSWPGNVRELRNVVERFLALPGIDPSSVLGVAAPRADSSARVEGEWDLPFHDAKAALLDRFERAYFERLLASHGGNISEAARVAGLSRQSCYRLMHKHGLRIDE